MADNQKYYYLKLKEDFYNDEAMIILQSMPDGYLYSDILMKLYLRSLKSNGKLLFKDLIPYTPSILATLVNHPVGVVEKGLQIFVDLGLIEILDNGVIFMLDIQNFIGKSSTEADRKRAYRAEIEQAKQEQLLEQQNTSGQMSRQISDKITPEIEIESEIKTDIEKESKREKPDSDESAPPPSSDVKGKKGKKSKKTKAPEPEKKAYGEFQNVFLTDEELEKLKSKYSDYQERIEKLSAGIESKGYKYKSHYATIISWANSDSKKSGRKEPEPKWVTKSAGNYNSYSQRQYSAEELDELEAKLTGVKTAGTDPEIAARAEALKQQLS